MSDTQPKIQTSNEKILKDALANGDASILAFSAGCNIVVTAQNGKEVANLTVPPISGTALFFVLFKKCPDNMPAGFFRYDTSTS